MARLGRRSPKESSPTKPTKPTNDPSDKKPCLILSIDGGGIRGLIPLRALNYLESCIATILTKKGVAHLANRPLARHFNIVTGTSTGGIIAAGLCCPKSGFPDQSACRVDDLINLYVDHGDEIFNEKATETDLAGWLLSLLRSNIFVTAKHDATVLEKLLEEKLGNWKISESLTKIILTAFDIVQREPVFITNVKTMVPGIEAIFRDYLFREAARATAAAPIYLDLIRLRNGGGGEQILVDGGVFANDPTLIAYLQAVREGFSEQQISILSLGTGFHYNKYIYKDAETWGLKDWLDPRRGIPLLSVLLEAPAKSTSRLMQKSFPGKYFRIDGDLGEKLSLDDASPTAIKKIDVAASAIVQDNLVEINRFADIIADARIAESGLNSPSGRGVVKPARRIARFKRASG